MTIVEFFTDWLRMGPWYWLVVVLLVIGSLSPQKKLQE